MIMLTQVIRPVVNYSKIRHQLKRGDLGGKNMSQQFCKNWIIFVVDLYFELCNNFRLKISLRLFLFQE